MSKIAREIEQAFTNWDYNNPLEQVVDDVIGDRMITRREVDQLRKDVESLKNTLEIVHVNLARAENEAATYKVTSEQNFHTALDYKVDAQSWFEQTMAGLNVVNRQHRANHDLRCKLWNTEKELNDLKKEIYSEPEFNQTTVTLFKNALSTWPVITSGTPQSIQGTWTALDSTKLEPVLISEPESRGNSWLLALLVLVILTGGAALIYYLSATNLLKL